MTWYNVYVNATDILKYFNIYSYKDSKIHNEIS